MSYVSVDVLKQKIFELRKSKKKKMENITKLFPIHYAVSQTANNNSIGTRRRRSNI